MAMLDGVYIRHENAKEYQVKKQGSRRYKRYRYGGKIKRNGSLFEAQRSKRFLVLYFRYYNGGRPMWAGRWF